MNATNITELLRKKNVNVEENALYNSARKGPLKNEYMSRFYINFYGLEESNAVVINVRSNQRFSTGGITKMNIYAP